MKIEYPQLEQLEVENKVVFVRVDFNVPVVNGEITDDSRIRGALPTLKYLMDQKAKLVIGSHRGRPKTDEDKQKLSLEIVGDRLGELLGVDVVLVEDPTSEAPKGLLAGLKAKQVILLENLRFVPGETKNGQELVDAITDYADFYVNDAFGASHRAHQSIVGLPKAYRDAKAIGFLMKKEIEFLDRVVKGEDRPFVAVMGGSKVSDKIGLIENLIDRVDTFVIGGAMAYTFLRAKNNTVGNSLVEEQKLGFARDLIDRLESRGKTLLLPEDHVVATSLDESADVRTTAGSAIDDGWLGVDIGPKSVATFSKAIAEAKCVFWNGPMGIFEKEAFASGTLGVAKAIGDCQGITVVGGGDSASAARVAGVTDQMTHVSTGGGASLEYLQGDQLPGLLAIRGKFFE